MARHRFILEQFEEFLSGGNVAINHAGPIPIWAGFIIEQNARILAILENTVTSNESQLQADLAQLIAINTDVKATLANQLGQITDLQGQVASLKTKLGDGSITADDLAALDSAVSDLAATAASAHATSSAGATNPAPSVSTDVQAPITSEPVDPTQLAEPVAPSVPVQAPITSEPADPVDPAKVSGADGSTDSAVAAPVDDSATGGDATAPGVAGQ